MGNPVIKEARVPATLTGEHERKPIKRAVIKRTQAIIAEINRLMF